MSSSSDAEPPPSAPFGRGLRDVPLAPSRRQDHASPPLYGPLSNHFSIQVIHGGYFLCAGKHRGYHKGHSIWYDYCDVDNWTPTVVASLVEEIGYEFEGRIRAYWCVPRLTVYKNGLREIKLGDNTMTENMKDCVLNGNHFQQIFLDHDDSMRSYISPVPVHSDDEDPPQVKFSDLRPKKEQVPVQEEQSHQLPVQEDHSDQVQEENADQVQVLHEQAEQDQLYDAKSEEESEEEEYIPGPPHPGEYIHTFQFEFRGRRKTCRVLNMDAEDVIGDSAMRSSAIHDSDEDFNPQLVDSDIDLQDDDDLFDRNIDCDKGKGLAVQEQPNDPVEDLDLCLPSYDEDKVKLNFKCFREEDLSKPEFQVGQTFASVELLRKAIKEYSCRERVDIKCPRNDRKRLQAICEEGCPWSLFASFDCRTKCLMVKKYNPKHTCIKKWSVKSFTAPFMAGKYIDSFRADENMNMKFFARVVQKD
ncbi:unnamed protein product [Triticum aestivum]|uniref:Uncharacterized protein n=1 Tax=Triticum aestivum TaxID=4565 RepID=A0A7H4LBE1_WHEAT|nr:unnamed protein product [Triticum aestivum]